MDCNKEEALRAKDLAEKKLHLKDFQGARKIAQKAQQLYSDVENISQMIMVCDVHCSAEKKLFGTETDWYGILQIEQTADEATIKKQYRKFALQLHPDKNKFPGAEAAFKLVGEAQRILLDREKRIAHDKKRNPSRPLAPYRPPPRANSNPTNGVQNNVRGNFPGYGAQYQPPTQPAQAFPNGSEAFWTMCPFCSVKYQYYRAFVNRSLSCQTCQKNFIAYDLKLPGASPVFSVTRPGFPQQRPSSKAGFSKVDIGPKQAPAAEKVRYNTSFNTGAGASGVNNKKRGRMHEEESSESFDTDSSTDSDKDAVMGEDGHLPEQRGSENVRRSSRQKKNISYKENISDDENDPMSPMKSNKSSGQPSADVEGSKGSLHEEEVSKSNKQDEEGGLKQREEVIVDDDDGSESDSPSTKEPEPEVLDYPDPDFSDFDKDRLEDCFRAGQVWAAYDVLDGMPRFYARIKKVLSRSFKVQITWLEADPDDENEKKWVNAGLPVSCGKFRHGKSDVAQERSVFSHIVSWEKGRDRDTYIVYPCVGETWAIFKNWDIHTYPDNPKEFEYEFVEILSDYTKEDGIRVGYLGKLEGFASVFARIVRKGASSFYIQPAELYRFGHKVPSFRLDGKEGEGVPKGSFELDPASVPVDLEAVEPEELEVNAVKMNHHEGNSSKNEDINRDAQEQAPSDENGAGDYGLSSSSDDEDSAPEEIPIPDSDFHNFDEDKSLGNFKHGQIWAVYADEDSLPKYYGQITKVDSGPEFEVHLRWLSCCVLPENVTPWHDKDMLISCGTFKVKKERPRVYTNSGSFSHLVTAEPVKGMFSISPKKGEVWAMYRKWDPGMTCSALEGCEYDIVEVIEETESSTKVLALERIEGFTSVFKGSKVTLEIPVAELLRFSHQVPSFKLTEEKNGSLRGFLDLDTAALPLYFFAASK